MFDKILQNAVKRLLDLLVNYVEKRLKIDLDGDGDIGEPEK